MPKFRVVRGRDAWAIEQATVDHPDVTTPEDAEEWASWNENADTLEWEQTGDVRTFDHTDIMEGEAWEVDDEELNEFEPYMHELHVSHQEHATILAALRYYQQNDMGEPANRSDFIHEIATNGDTEVSLDANDIDELCERINQ